MLEKCGTQSQLLSTTFHFSLSFPFVGVLNCISLLLAFLFARNIIFFQCLIAVVSIPNPGMTLPPPGVVLPTALGGTVPVVSGSGPGKVDCFLQQL